jgi:hypothetical protein
MLDVEALKTCETLNVPKPSAILELQKVLQIQKLQLHSSDMFFCNQSLFSPTISVKTLPFFTQLLVYSSTADSIRSS